MADESEINKLHASGDYDEATSAALKLYGAEILGLLMALHRDETAAGDAFSEFSERLWRSMERFRGDCSMRTWAYAIARGASVDLQRSLERDRGRKTPLSKASKLSKMAERIKSTTLTYLRSEKQSAIAQLRAELSPDDQFLLVLRIDREMAWNDLARVFLGNDDVDESTLKRESARLRQRFQNVKARMLKLAKKRGIVRGE